MHLLEIVSKSQANEAHRILAQLRGDAEHLQALDFEWLALEVACAEKFQVSLSVLRYIYDMEEDRRASYRQTLLQQMEAQKTTSAAGFLQQSYRAMLLVDKL
jgi:hypothetical protein